MFESKLDRFGRAFEGEPAADVPLLHVELKPDPGRNWARAGSRYLSPEKRDRCKGQIQGLVAAGTARRNRHAKGSSPAMTVFKGRGFR